MAHRIDAEHDQEGGQGAVVSLRTGPVAPASRRPAVQPLPMRPVPRGSQVSGKPIWDKDNFGFWLAVCILISLLFSIVYHALG